MRVVRSDVAHGKINSIDAKSALALPGVHAVWTHADVADIPHIPFRLTGLKPLEPYQQPVLAKDVVRYVGEPVAAIFADDPYLAEDAADLVALSIEPFPATISASEPPGQYEQDLTTEPGLVQKSMVMLTRVPRCPCDRLAGTFHRTSLRRSDRDPRSRRTV